jgi:hypothetical protein
MLPTPQNLPPTAFGSSVFLINWQRRGTLDASFSGSHRCREFEVYVISIRRMLGDPRNCKV